MTDSNGSSESRKRAARPRLVKEKFSTQVDVDVAASVRSTVLALQRMVGQHVTLSTFTTEALTEHVRRTEADLNDGEPFDVVEAQLRPGARVKPPASRRRTPEPGDKGP